MNKDTLTSIMGLIVAVATALQTYNAPPTTSKTSTIVGYVMAAAAAAWGFWTNKK